MIIAFELSMPNVGSWNGKWTGEGECRAIIKNYGKAKCNIARAMKVLEKKSHRYNFGDGWTACISIREVDAKEARRLRRQSKGFCGYEWMVESIIEHGNIQYKDTTQ